MKQILLIDEKEFHPDGTGSDFFRAAQPDLQQLIKLVTQIEDVVNIPSEIEVDLKFAPTAYEWVFLHDSYQDKNLDEGQLTSFTSKLKNYVLFSGGKTPNLATKVTSRALLFSTLGTVLESYLKTGYFPIKSLFDRSYHVYYPLLDVLEDHLFENEGSTNFLQAPELRIWLRIMNYTDEQICTQILPLYEKLSPVALSQKIEDWRRKNF